MEAEEMNETIALAIYVGRLEARVEALEKKLAERGPVPSVHLDLGRTETAGDEKAEQDAQTASRLMQEGIDNIMAYQWPPAKGGERS